MDKSELKEYLRDNLKIVVSETGPDCGNYVNVSIVLEGEIISTDSYSIEGNIFC
jgi:hypothetical protein